MKKDAAQKSLLNKPPDDIATEGLKFLIHLAKKGDGKLLADSLRSEQELDHLLHSEATAELLREFLAGVVSGEIKLAPPCKLTYIAKSNRWLAEKLVAWGVNAHIVKRRKKSERDYWTRKLCDLYGTTPNAVANFRRSSRRRRHP